MLAFPVPQMLGIFAFAALSRTLVYSDAGLCSARGTGLAGPLGVLLALFVAVGTARAAELEPPAGPPPELLPADPNWNERPAETAAHREPTAPPARSSVDAGLGFQLFGVQGKVMPGVSFRFGKGLYWGELEFTPIWLIEASEEFGDHFLGNQWAAYFSLAPVKLRRVELLAGIGLDAYHLWGVHGDVGLFALALKLASHLRMSDHASVFATLRGYPLSSSGLELGTNRKGERLIPVMGSLGLEWRFE